MLRARPSGHYSESPNHVRELESKNHRYPEFYVFTQVKLSDGKTKTVEILREKLMADMAFLSVYDNEKRWKLEADIESLKPPAMPTALPDFQNPNSFS